MVKDMFGIEHPPSQCCGAAIITAGFMDKSWPICSNCQKPIKQQGLSLFDKLADNLIEKRYQLRIEHNHGDMKWYAYYAGKENRQLFDDDIDWETASDTPTGALENLTLIMGDIGKDEP